MAKQNDSAAKQRVLVVGVGSIGERHARCFLATGRATVSICETNADLRRTIAQRYDVTAYADLDEAIAGGADVAVICTPAQLHIPMASRLVQAGMHVLIEKPLSTTTDGVDELPLVADRGVVAAVAYTWRANPGVRRLRHAVIEERRVGQPLLVNITAGQHFPTFRPAYREIYYKDHKTGGGAIQDALTHMVNTCEWLVGPITRLCADADDLRLEGVEVEDSVNLIARHGQVMASYTLNQHQAHNETSITVVGDAGVARLLAHEKKVLFMAAPGQPWQEESLGAIERDTPYIAQAHDFLDAVQCGAPVVCSLEEGLQTLRVNLAALASVRSGAWVRVRASQEEGV